ncbi:MAG: DUF2723 domain-containing protein [Candidatus Alcyoniella australis]|nr:DUF2723 domain-containing protein [Candidatus Alcyoniella australis]
MRIRGWMLVPVVFAVYLLTAAPGLYWRDCPEFVLVAFGMDISHPAGSPAYAMLGKLATMLPLGSIAFRVNLLSCLGAALAAWALFEAARRLLRRMLPQDAPAWTLEIPALLAASMCVFSLSLWTWGVVAEVYSLEVALLAAAIALALGPGPRSANRPGGPETTMLLLGLASGVHINMALTLPVFALYFLFERPGPRLRTVLLAALAFAVGASVYLYLPLRSLADLAYDFGNPETLRGLLIHVTGQSHVDSLSIPAPWPVVLRNLSLIPGFVVSEFGWPYSLLALCGALIVLARRGPALLLYGSSAGTLLLFARTWDVAFGYIPIFALLAIVGVLPLGLLFAYLVRRENAQGFERGRAAQLFTVLAALAALIAPAAAHYPLCDMSKERNTDFFARELMRSLPTEALVVTHHSGLSYPLFAMQTVWRMRPDVVHLHRAHLSDPYDVAARYPGMEPLAQHDEDDLAQRLERVALTRPLYWDYPLEGRPLLDAKLFSSAGAFALYEPEGPGFSQQLLAQSDDPLFKTLLLPTMMLIKRDPRDWSGRQLLAQICTARARLALNAEQDETATLWFRTALEMAEPIPGNFTQPMYTAPFVNAARLAMLEGQSAKALELVDQGLSVDSMDVELLLLRFELLAGSGRDAEASAVLRQAYERSPDDPRVALHTARRLLDAGEQQRAREVLLRMVAPPADERLDQRRFATAQALLASIERRAGDQQAAAGHYLSALAIEPDAARLRVQYGRLLQEMGNPNQGRRQIKLGLALVGKQTLARISTGLSSDPASSRVP